MSMTDEVNPFEGKWRIIEIIDMDMDDVDLHGEAHITLDEENSGTFSFFVLNGQINHRLSKRGGHSVVEFSWEGEVDGDVSSGWGWCTHKDEHLVGLLYVHFGAEYSFVAKRP